MVDSNPELTLQKELAQQSIANDPNAIYADSLKETKVQNILSQINPDNLLSDIEHRIRGQKKDSYGEWHDIVENKSPISELLVADFISFLGCVLNQNTSMSNFSNQEINNIMEVIIDWVKDSLTTNAEKYNIEGNYSEYDRIGHIICISCFTVFKRALNGRESFRIFRIMSLNQNDNIAEQKGGFMNALRFWK